MNKADASEAEPPPPHARRATDPARFSQEVGATAARKLSAQRNPTKVWFGLGMMGLIGWSVVIPTLLGAAVGSWLDARYAGAHAWTLALLVAGLVVGCFNAWRWIAKEDRAMPHRTKEGPTQNG